MRMDKIKIMTRQKNKQKQNKKKFKNQQYQVLVRMHNWHFHSLKVGMQNGTGILEDHLAVSSVQFSSVTQSCPTPCDPMNCNTPGLPVHHQFPEFTQTHVHQVSDAIQPSHPLLSPSSPVPNPFQHQGLFQ